MLPHIKVPSQRSWAWSCPLLSSRLGLQGLRNGDTRELREGQEFWGEGGPRPDPQEIGSWVVELGLKAVRLGEGMRVCHKPPSTCPH